MPNLPTPAASGDVWGNTLNTFLNQITPSTNGGLNSAPSDPTSVTTGYTYFNTVSNTVKKYNGTGWDTILDPAAALYNIQAQATIQSLAAPVGAVSMFWGTIAPSGWLSCDGSTQNTSDFPRLSASAQGKKAFAFVPNPSTDQLIIAEGHTFAMADAAVVISQGTLPSGVNATTTYYIRKIDNNTITLHFTSADATADTNVVNITNIGTLTAGQNHFVLSGTVTATFALPDLRGRTPIGIGTGTGLTARTLGAAGGAETHTLTPAQMPSHAHGVNDPGHAHAVGTADDNNFGNGTTIVNNNRPVDANASTYAAGTGISIQAAGSGAAHNNMQPFIALNFIIKAG